jgi:hypothetical protein
MRFGTFSLPVKLSAYDNTNHLLHTQVINTGNTFQNLIIQTTPSFTRLEFEGGNNEAYLVRICVY